MEIGPFETDFGPTIEHYVFYNGSPLGKLIDTDSNQTVRLNLNDLPKKGMKPELNLIENLISMIDRVKVVYESDCDQHELRRYELSEYRLSNFLNNDLEPLNGGPIAFSLSK